MSNEPKKPEKQPEPAANAANAAKPAAEPAAPSAMFGAFDPMAYWAQSQQSFHKLVGDAYGRAHSFADQYAALETQMITRAQGAVVSWAQLAQDAIAYAAQLSAEARKLGLETARKIGSGPVGA
jgi:hypothetical protein